MVRDSSERGHHRVLQAFASAAANRFGSRGNEDSRASKAALERAKKLSEAYVRESLVPCACASRRPRVLASAHDVLAGGVPAHQIAIEVSRISQK